MSNDSVLWFVGKLVFLLGMVFLTGVIGMLFAILVETKGWLLASSVGFAVCMALAICIGFIDVYVRGNKP